ncbi:glycoside hydrolase family 88 protein [Sphingobacterium sp. DN00404]|uniref:Glycoside hydrolase family 88 protein n=1 Tax=Sphingobacterium micropteri TaxID=2763501 RepID=A0ABR7YUQ5_9SPHI|nr:glycoside hydrolase family 88 protein [Sphingobacterium micropteri]MBD1435086.1 glycoside hydrolase family 88 protein [Sphingobacterium micropteri]
MKKGIHIILCLLLFAQVGFGQEKALSEKMAITAMDSLYKDARFTNKEKGPQWTYDMGVVLEGMVDVWRNTGDNIYFDYVQRWMDQFVTEDGDIRNYRPEEYNIDHVKNGRSLLFLYKVTGKPKYLKASEKVYNQLLTHPRTKEGGFWHKKLYPYQMWLDGLYMAQPFYTEYADLMGIDSIYDDVVNQFTYMENHARDEKTGLLYHGWDESRNERWANPETGLSKHFWARGMGWYAMALVDVLDYFPTEHPGREKLMQILHRTLTAVAKYQDPKTSVWYDIVDLGTREGNYVEASASSMFVYAMAKAVRKGYVPKTDFQKHIDKGYAGLVKQFITPGGPDRVNINHVVTVSGLGGSKNYRDGSFEYYMSEPVKPNDPKGVGPFISAASEVEFARSAKSQKKVHVTLDNYYNNEYKKAPDGQMKPYHYLWDGQDNNGFFLLGRIFEQYGGVLNTLREAPTQQKLVNSNVYIIVDPDTEKETTSPNFMNETEANEIAQWVRGGGVLVLLANDSGNCEITKFNTLSQKFGITFNEDNRNMVKGSNYADGAVVIPSKTGIFKKTQKIYVKEISTINAVKPAKPLVQEQGDIIIATAKYGKGTVFAIGDPWLYNEYVDGRKLPAEYQNFDAAHELVQWLLRKAK